MGFFDKIATQLGLKKQSHFDLTPLDEMREAMEIARVARRIEDYDRSLQALDRAMQLADDQQDSQSVTVIALHQADILIEKRQFDEAEKLLQTVQQTAEAVNQRGFMSYALSSLGVMRMRQGEWNAARETFESARKVASDAGATGPEGRAMGHLADVYMHEGNASYATHLLQECLQKINAAGDVELSSYFVGRLGEAMIANGTESDGFNLLERALHLAEQMRDRAMKRRWSLTIAEHLFDQKRYPDAYNYFKAALTLFDAEPDPAYIRALAHTSRVCLSIGEPEEALVYAEQAVQTLETSEDRALQAEASAALGLAFRANRRSREAIPHLLAAADGTQEPRSAVYLERLRNLAAAQMDAGDYNESLATYQQALDAAQHTDLPESTAEIQRDMGLLYVRQSQFNEAINEWSAALNTFESANNTNQVARLYCDIASARRQLGMGNRAIRDYEKALMALNHVDDLATRGLVLSNAGNAYADQGDVESAAAFFRDAIDIAEKINDLPALSTRLGNYGWFLMATGELSKAIEQITRALEISRERDLILNTAVQTDNLGLVYDARSQYKTALGYHEDALKILAEVDAPHPRWEVIFKVNAALTQLALGRTSEAITLIDEAFALARTLPDLEALTAALNAKARLMIHESQPAEAAPLLSESTAIARRADLRHRLTDSLTLTSEMQAAAGDRDAARDTWDEAHKLLTMIGSPQAKQNPFWLNPPTPKPDTGTES